MILRIGEGSQEEAGFKFSQIIPWGKREREREKYSVTPFPGIIEDPCGPSSLMARYRTVPLLDNRQILLFMNVAGPSSRHRRRISLSFVDYTHRRLYGDCRLQSRPRHVSKIVFHETYPRTLMLSIKIDWRRGNGKQSPFSKLLDTLMKPSKKELKILRKRRTMNDHLALPFKMNWS